MTDRITIVKGVVALLVVTLGAIAMAAWGALAGLAIVVAFQLGGGVRWLLKGSEA